MSRLYKFDIEITSAVPIEKLFKFFATNYEYYIPQAAPLIVHSIENIQGHSGVGSISKINFAQGQTYKYAKVEVVVLDVEKFLFKFIVIDGDVLGGGILKIEIELKIEISPDKKSILKIQISHHTEHDSQLSNEYLQAVHKNTAALYKAVETYFFKHPNA